MELWLLGAGAIVLIGITLWIVWPARAADAAVGTTVRGEEVSTLPMAENVRRGTTPQGDQFEDQYTSATADLSAGGVAAAVDPIPGGVAVDCHPLQLAEYFHPVAGYQPTHDRRTCGRRSTYVGLRSDGAPPR